MVGPDNGLLWPAAERCGGIAQAVDISHSPFQLEPVSATFHGRDIFAPVAARLASGASLADAGERCDPAQLVRLELPRPRVERDGLLAHVLYIDRFGNLQLDAGRDAGARLELEPGEELTLRAGSRSYECRFVGTFSDVDRGQLLLYEDSYERLAVAVRDGSAAERLDTEADAEIRIGRPG
jgi:S-adenosylmethionine hydrolase